MLSELSDWLQALLPAGEFTPAIGEWVEPKNADNVRYCAITQEGGAPMMGMVRQPRYRVILLGRRNQRGDSQQLASLASNLVQVAINGDLVPCGAAAIRAMSEPVGPGFTAEQRAWFSIDFQITF